MNLVSLQLKTSDNFEKNLNLLVSKIKSCSKDDIILAPELFLNGYAYDKMDEAVDITNKAIPILKKLSIDKTIALTFTTKYDNKYFNTLKVFYKGQIIYSQHKHKLFVMNDERKFFTAGIEKDIKTFQIGDLKVASLICFELRFSELWKQIQGADIILIPAMWGKIRAENFITLTKALAIMNQCFVLCSDSSNDNMAKNSGIISPFGIEYRDNRATIIKQKLDLNEIKKMRRYLNIGII
ncbi:MAG: carbon-nitrogen hydrolase family protein [Campylobacterota bacterium]|nr:carbon-nitrogen hydrolase family protein [Campylobacterota bacterium]